MNRQRILLALIGLSLIITLAARTRQIGFHATYAAMSLDERLAQADVIVAGKIVEISDTRWNQDSGAYWQEVDEEGEQVRQALPLYTVTIAVRETLAGTLSDSFLTVTILGVSPRSAGHDDHAPAIGDEVVLMASQTQLAWRDGNRTVWYPLGYPAESYLVQANDGLYYLPDTPAGFTTAALAEQIALQRTAK